MANLSQSLTKLVENSCKTLCKSPCKSLAKLCVFLTPSRFYVQNPTFPPRFTHFPTIFPTTTSPLYLANLFHYSTASTTTTTNNILIIKL